MALADYVVEQEMKLRRVEEALTVLEQQQTNVTNRVKLIERNWE